MVRRVGREPGGESGGACAGRRSAPAGTGRARGALGADLLGAHPAGHPAQQPERAERGAHVELQAGRARARAMGGEGRVCMREGCVRSFSLSSPFPSFLSPSADCACKLRAVCACARSRQRRWLGGALVAGGQRSWLRGLPRARGERTCAGAAGAARPACALTAAGGVRRAAGPAARTSAPSCVKPLPTPSL